MANGLSCKLADPLFCQNHLVRTGGSGNDLIPARRRQVNDALAHPSEQDLLVTDQQPGPVEFDLQGVELDHLAFVLVMQLPEDPEQFFPCAGVGIFSFQLHWFNELSGRSIGPV